MNSADMDTPKLWEILGQQRDIAQKAEGVRASMERLYYEARVKQILSSHYGYLGEVSDVCELFGGEVNRNYEAHTKRDGSQLCLFVRQYEPDKQAYELEYEHNLFFHLREHGFDLTPVPIPAENGDTYVRCVVGDGEFFFSVNEFLEGDNTYQWERNNVTETACESAARALARFHAAACTYDPLENWRNREPVIQEQLAFSAMSQAGCPFPAFPPSASSFFPPFCFPPNKVIINQAVAFFTASRISAECSSAHSTQRI